ATHLGETYKVLPSDGITLSRADCITPAQKSWSARIPPCGIQLGGNWQHISAVSNSWKLLHSAMRKKVAGRFSFRDAGRGCHRIVAMHYRLPTTRMPIVIVGGGGIVRDAHLPAYRIAGLPVHGICDLDPERARSLASAHGIERVYATAADAFRQAP